MRRRALALAAGLVALGGTATAAGSGGRQITVGTGLREFRVTLYRTAVHPGVVSFSVHNFGADPHDLAVRRLGRTYAKAPELLPGDTARLRVRLTRPGRYTVYCTLAGHAARGMRAVIRVR